MRSRRFPWPRKAAKGQNSMKHTIAVLITYYNEKEILRECLDSLAGQTDRPDEIFVYDDASDFEASDFVPRGFPVKIIRGDKNSGPAFGRNKLLEVSTSEYVHFHDVDELFHPSWCQRVRRVIDIKGVDAVFTEVSSFSDDKLVCERVLGLESLTKGDKGDLAQFAIRGCILPAASTLRRETAVKAGPFRYLLGHCEDFDFHVRMAVTNPTHAEILEPLIIKRLRPKSRSTGDLPGCWASGLEAVRLLSQEIKPFYHQDLAERAARLGTKLLASGNSQKAREAFCLAKKLGPPKFLERHKLYRLAARAIGPLNAERLSAIYRRQSR